MMQGLFQRLWGWSSWNTPIRGLSQWLWGDPHEMIKFEVCPNGSGGDLREMLKFEISSPPPWASPGYAPDIDKVAESISK